MSVAAIEFWLLCASGLVLVYSAWRVMLWHLERQEAKYMRERAERSRRRWGRPS